MPPYFKYPVSKGNEILEVKTYVHTVIPEVNPKVNVFVYANPFKMNSNYVFLTFTLYIDHNTTDSSDPGLFKVPLW